MRNKWRGERLRYLAERQRDGSARVRLRLRWRQSEIRSHPSVQRDLLRHYGQRWHPWSRHGVSITPSGLESVLYSFGASSTDGEAPLRLALGADGNLYGTTNYGGTHGDGTVFRLTPAGTETILYSFGASTTDGDEPTTLLQAVDGNFYGTTSGGGAHGYGTAFKLTPAGVETVLYSFGASATDGQIPDVLLQGSDGNLYGTTTGGGNFAGGTLFKLTPTGTMTMLFASFGGSNAGGSCSGGAFNPPNGAIPLGMILGSDGAFYGFTDGGECSGSIPVNGAIFRVAP